MEFKEFSNPEEKDYDINSSFDGINNTMADDNNYSMQLMELIGVLEDIDESYLQENYGISMEEYLNPNAKTIEKVSERINAMHTGMHR